MMAPIASLMDRATDLMKGGLAVIGATFLGAIVIGFAANFLTQLLGAKKLPPSLFRFVRIAGGLTSGFVVGMFVFGGGGGWGLGGGSGTGKGTPTNLVSSDAPSDSSTGEQPTITRVGVTLLGGQRVIAGKFYRLDGQATGKTLTELKKELLKATSTGVGPGHLTVRIYEDSVAQDHPAVHDLESWANEHKWRISLEKIPGTIPDVAGAKS